MLLGTQEPKDSSRRVRGSRKHATKEKAPNYHGHVLIGGAIAVIAMATYMVYSQYTAHAGALRKDLDGLLRKVEELNRDLQGLQRKLEENKIYAKMDLESKVGREELNRDLRELDRRAERRDTEGGGAKKRY